MKKILILAIAACGAATVSVSSAEAAVCSARSATGSWGVGRGYNFRQARALALTYCAVNTPRGYTCYVTGCRY